MIMEENRTNGLEVLEDNELLMAQLFRQYAEKFPDRDDLWSGLALEQIEHGRSVRRLLAKVRTGEVLLNGSRFPSTEIRTFREYVKGLLYDTLERAISLKAAIETALYLQWSLIKQGVFVTFKEDPDELKYIMRSLTVAACRRRDRLLRILEETREPPPEPEISEVSQYREESYRSPNTYAPFTHLGYYPLDF